MTMLAEFFSPLQVSASGMRAERTRLDVAATNLANARTTRTPEGGPYRRRRVIFETMLNETMDKDPREFRWMGVRVAEISLDYTTPFNTVDDPEHPGQYIQYPNVEPHSEMVDLMDASRAYEANAAAFKISRDMMRQAVELGRA